MSNKVFKVGQKWRRRGGSITEITKIDDCRLPIATQMEFGEYWHYADGRGCTGETVYDLVELLSEPPITGIKMPDGTPVKTDFVKHDTGKAPLSLLAQFGYELSQVAHILDYGAKKYDKDNWKKCDDVSRYYDAALRHMLAYAGGEYSDPESDYPHAAHVITNMLFAMYLDAEKGNDK